jgi:hypothetical protein
MTVKPMASPANPFDARSSVAEPQITMTKKNVRSPSRQTVPPGLRIEEVIPNEAEAD